jgi:putative ABC transport system permease protein
LLQYPGNGRAVVIKTTMEPEAMIAAVRRQIFELDPELPIYDVRTLTERLGNSLAPERLNLTLLICFAAMALLLAVIGLYGVISYLVTQRAHEIGIRMALGAQSCDVLKLIIGQGLKLLSIGVLLGICGALALTHLMRTLLFGVSPTDPLSFALVPLLLAVIALLACYIPARRATKADPMVALRHE